MKIITVIEGQTLHDIAVQEYGDARAVFVLMEDNPDLIVNLDTDLNAGDQLNIREGFTMESDPVTVVKIPQSPYVEIISSEGQTIWDLSMMCYGSAEGAFLLIEDNPDLLESINDNVPEGSVIKVDTRKVIDRDVLRHYTIKGIRPNSGDNPLEGVGYWRVEKDNVIS